MIILKGTMQPAALQTSDSHQCRIEWGRPQTAMAETAIVMARFMAYKPDAVGTVLEAARLMAETKATVSKALRLAASGTPGRTATSIFPRPMPREEEDGGRLPEDLAKALHELDECDKARREFASAMTARRSWKRHS